MKAEESLEPVPLVKSSSEVIAAAPVKAKKKKRSSVPFERPAWNEEFASGTREQMMEFSRPATAKLAGSPSREVQGTDEPIEQAPRKKEGRKKWTQPASARLPDQVPAKRTSQVEARAPERLSLAQIRSLHQQQVFQIAQICEREIELASQLEEVPSSEVSSELLCCC